jgi:hypothetical protein
VGKALTISIDNLRHGWVDILLQKGDATYHMLGVSYTSDFVSDLAKTALDGLFSGAGRSGMWLDSEGSGWVLRLSDCEQDRRLVLQCGVCHSWEESKLFIHGGDLERWLEAKNRFLGQSGRFEVAVTPEEFGEAVATALETYEAKFADDGLVPCNFVSQPKRPIAAIRAALQVPFSVYTDEDTSEIIAIFINTAPDNDQAAEHKND